jgi:cobaltochelatase CobS
VSKTAPSPTPIDLDVAFGVQTGGIKVAGLTPGAPHVPPSNPNYVWELDYVRDLMVFWTSGERAMKIEGDPATGKTSMVMEWHARLNWPCFVLPINPRTTAEKLIGGFAPGPDGKPTFVLGPVAVAAKCGYSVLLDEYNVLDPAEAVGLNALMEGYPYTIPETGEVIKPHQSFRVFACENAFDSALAMAGRNAQDASNDDRFCVMRKRYMPVHLEENALSRYIQTHKMLAGKIDKAQADMLAKGVVSIATKVRKAYGEYVSGINNGIDKPLSLRAMQRWVLRIPLYANAKGADGQPLCPAVVAMQKSLRMTDAMSAAVEAMVIAEFGSTP